MSNISMDKLSGSPVPGLANPGPDVSIRSVDKMLAACPDLSHPELWMHYHNQANLAFVDFIHRSTFSYPAICVAIKDGFVFFHKPNEGSSDIYHAIFVRRNLEIEHRKFQLWNGTPPEHLRSGQISLVESLRERDTSFPVSVPSDFNLACLSRILSPRQTHARIGDANVHRIGQVFHIESGDPSKIETGESVNSDLSYAAFTIRESGKVVGQGVLPPQPGLEDSSRWLRASVILAKLSLQAD